MPDVLSPDDIRLQRIAALRQIGMPNAGPMQPQPIAPDVQDGASQLQSVSTPQLQKITGESPVKPLNFHQREALPITTPDAPAGSISANQSQFSKLQDERVNHLGTPENHPGTLGKVGHILSTVGNIAGDVFAPGVMANIPGTDLNKRLQEHSLQGEIAGQQKEKVAENATNSNTQVQQQKADTEQNVGESTANHLDAETDAINAAGANPEDKKVGEYTNADGKQTVIFQKKDNSTYEKQFGDVNDKNKSVPPHVTYDSGIPVTVTAGDKVYDINDPKLPPELKPLVASANRAHGTHVQESKDVAAAGAARTEAKEAKAPANEFDKTTATNAAKAVDTAHGADFRYRSMNSSVEPALKGDQQAMLNLLTNHIGMTLGMQKGARITKDILHEAQASAPWLDRKSTRLNSRHL